MARMSVFVIVVLMIYLSTEAAGKVNIPGCLRSTPYPLVFNATRLQPKGDIFTPGFSEGKYPTLSFCDYVIQAPIGYVIKLTFKEMDLKPASRCSKDKVFVTDGPSSYDPDLGEFCALEVPPYPVVSTKNAMHLSFRSDARDGRKGFHAQYEAIRPEDICEVGYSKCRNNNCYRPTQKCDGNDDCHDGTDEENCDLPHPTATCGATPIPPNESDRSPDRVVGGAEAKSGSWPWQADLQLGKFYPENHICGGTLINAEWVMTALHCLAANPEAVGWKIILGNHDRYVKEPSEQHRYVKRLVIYPGFTGNDILGKPVNINHDIALMQLNAPVKFTDRVQPACLPAQDFELPLNTKCFSTGWGETRGSGAHEKLKQAILYTQPDRKCANVRNATMICVQSNTGIQDVCHGDSGGPLSCKIDGKWHVMGITSFGSVSNMISGLCAVSKMGTVFNKVSAKTSWINDMIVKFG